VAYRDDHEALLARADALERELARERERASTAAAEARKLRRDLGLLTRALGRGVVRTEGDSRLLQPLVVCLALSAALLGVAYTRTVRPTRFGPTEPIPIAATFPISGSIPKRAVAHAGAIPEARLVPSGMGLVDLDTRPWSHVWLDGQQLGVTPIDGMILSAGIHSLGFETPDQRVLQRSVWIRDGETVRIDMDLTPDM
jgi:hypothetical protein